MRNLEPWEGFWEVHFQGLSGEWLERRRVWKKAELEGWNGENEVGDDFGRPVDCEGVVLVLVAFNPADCLSWAWIDGCVWDFECQSEQVFHECAEDFCCGQVVDGNVSCEGLDWDCHECVRDVLCLFLSRGKLVGAHADQDVFGF